MYAIARSLFRCLRGQLAVGRRIGQLNGLAGIDPDLALEQDQVLRPLVFDRDQRLLLRGQLDAGAQPVEIRGRAGLMRGVSMILEHLRLCYQRLGVFNLARVGNRAQIRRRYPLHDLASRRHLAEIRRALGRTRRLQPGNHRTGKQDLVVSGFARRSGNRG